MLDTEVDQIIHTADPVKPPRPTAADILAPDDFFEECCSASFAPVLVEGVEVKGQPVYVAKLTAAGLDSYFKELDGVSDAESRGACLAFCIVRPNGVRTFAATDRTRLSTFTADKTQAITGTFFEANGLGARKK